MVDAGYADIWAELHEKLPWHKTPEQLQRRKDMGKGFDNNGNGFLSLAEVDKGMQDVVKLPALFALKPVLIRAFTAAKTKNTKPSKHGDDYVSKGEFRWLLKYSRQYYELWVAFDRIDKDGDKKLDEDELEKCMDE